MIIPFDDLFALRVVLQDEFDNETDIIYELKRELVSRGLTGDTLNKYLTDFYANYGINITEENIKSVNYPRMNTYRPILFPPSSDLSASTNILSLFTTLLTMPLNNIFSSLTASGNIEEPEDTPNQEHDSVDEGEQVDPIEDNEEGGEDREEEYDDTLRFPSVVTMRFNGRTGTFNYNQESLQILPENLLNELNLLLNPQMNDVSVTLNENDLTKLEKFIPTETLESKCSICINDMDTQNEVTRLPCKHEFHTECIEPWLKQYNYKCPVCRTEVGKSEAKI